MKQVTSILDDKLQSLVCCLPRRYGDDSGNLLMTNVDLHSHVIPPAILDAAKQDPHRFGITVTERNGKLFLDRPGHRSIPVSQAFHDVEAKIEGMDRMRIDISAISVAPPAFFYSLSPEAGLAAARINNDGIAQMVAAHPARLRGMATLPMQDPDAAIVELERVVKTYGFKAVQLGTSIEGRQLSDPSFRAVLKSIAQLKCLLFTHPYTCVAEGGMDAYNLMILMGYPLDTTIMVAHLMLSGTLDELPDLQILIPHGGGFIPYQIGRIAHGYKMHSDLRSRCKTPPDQLLKRFYFDALTHSGQSVRHLIETVGADRIVIGTDHPYDAGLDQPVAAVEAIPNLTDEERHLICGGNALRLLGEDK